MQNDESKTNIEQIHPTKEARPDVRLPAQEGINPKEGISKKPEETENFLEEAIGGLKKKLRSTKKKPTEIPKTKDNLTAQIEEIMEQDLGDAYNELTPIQKQEFKIKGERTAWEIRNLMKKAHVGAKTIFKLILEWLKVLPGINRFFLEQEAKIKTDKILALKK